MTEEQMLKYSLEFIQIEIDSIKEYIHTDLKIFYNERIQKRYTEFIKKYHPISISEQKYIYDLFEKAKM